MTTRAPRELMFINNFGSLSKMTTILSVDRQTSEAKTSALISKTRVD